MKFNIAYNDDARKMEQLTENMVDLIITSPPYFNLVDYNDDNQIGITETYDNYIESLNKVGKRCIYALKENGTIAIMWNFLDYKKELEGKIIDIQKKYTKLTFNASEEKQRDEDIVQFFGENKYKLKIYENNYLQNYENFIGNQLSMSYSLKESDEKYNEYVSEFKKLFEEFSEDNMVTIHNNTYCYFGNVNG